MTHPIPQEALDDRLGWIGTTGSGKTYNASAAVERLLHLKARCIIVDPLDVWWGLRRKADGKAPAFDVVIFGGAHGDLPVNEHAGSLIGEAVAGAAQSCIISTADLPSKSAERRFMLSFLEALYRKASGEPVHLIFDEADLWAPQKALEPQLQAKMEQLVRRGRVKGFIPWLISQRPATISKDVLSQMDGLVMFKLTSPHDRDAIGDWVQGQADKAQWKDIWSNMPTLQRGQGLVWVPARGILATHDFPQKQTYDSSRTPKRGEQKRKIELTPIDLGALKERLGTVEAEAKANDPRELRAEIARLKTQAKNITQNITAPDPKALEKSYLDGWERGHADGRIVGLNIALERCKAIREANKAVALAIDTAQGLIERDRDIPPKNKTQPLLGTPFIVEKARSKTQSTSFPKTAPRANPLPKKSNGSSSDLTRPQERIVASLNFWRSIGYSAPSREQVAAVAGFKGLTGHFNTSLSALRTQSIVDYPSGGNVSLAQNIGETFTHEEARRKMLSILKNPQLRIIDGIKSGEAISREELAERSQFAGLTGHFNTTLSRLRTLGIVTYPGRGNVALSEWAMELLS
jgi:hypothetical protein